MQGRENKVPTVEKKATNSIYSFKFNYLLAYCVMFETCDAVGLLPACPPPKFQCPNIANRCLQPCRLCDGTNDCGDWSDESGPNCCESPSFLLEVSNYCNTHTKGVCNWSEWCPNFFSDLWLIIVPSLIFELYNMLAIPWRHLPTAGYNSRNHETLLRFIIAWLSISRYSKQILLWRYSKLHHNPLGDSYFAPYPSAMLTYYSYYILHPFDAANWMKRAKQWNRKHIRRDWWLVTMQ